ncbi:hypothetical protein [Actinoplanes solisilvae]|uniref:hypothetical protein n=1 Tax=Actinoplanes solisilvae TaxID=2486853 RepID=UPI000FD8348F|nr:hypothetical protein [Actinoplanes solisilvae]
MRTVYRRGLPALLTVALTTGVVGFGTPALAAGAAPTGTFTLSANAIWSGQRVTLTQNDLNDPEGDAVTRKIFWGDGASVETNGTETSWTHTYINTPATYTVSVKLNDGETEVPATLASPTVAITNAPGTLGWKNSTVWTYPGYYNEATFAPTNLPTNADQAWTDWKDGEYTLLKEGAASTEAGHWYPTGTFSPTVQFENKNGKANVRTANALNVRDDTTAPTAGFTWPAKNVANAAKSYQTLRGTGRDSEAGADGAEVWIYKWNNVGFIAYWDFARKNWIKYNGDDIPMTAIADVPVSASGTWAVPVNGFAKGWKIEVGYSVYDKVGNYSEPKWADFTLTS